MVANILPGYMYSDLLDSVKTAHPQETDWWRPQTKEEQEAAYAVARADVMVRILLGETITLSNNQIMDSYAWLGIIREIGSLAKGFAELPWPVFAFSFYDYGQGVKCVSPDTFKNMASALLRQEKFALSAWGNISPAQRRQLAESINCMAPGTGVPYKNMPKDDTLKNLLKSLENTYKYLSFYETFREADSIKTGQRMPSCFPAYGREQYKISIWNSLLKVRELINKKYPEMRTVKETIDELEKYFSKDQDLAKYKESRSVLYNALAAVYGVSPGQLSSDTRLKMEEFQKYIDWFYNQKVGRSLLPLPRGLYTMSDDLAETDITKDIDDYSLVQNVTDFDVSYPAVIKHVPVTKNEIKEWKLAELNWRDILEILQDPEYTGYVLRWRANLMSSVETPEERQQAIHALNEERAKMLEFVADQMSESLVKKINDNHVIQVLQKSLPDFTQETVTLLATRTRALVGAMVAHNTSPSLLSLLAATLTSVFLNNAGNTFISNRLKSGEERRKKTVAGGVQSFLQDKAQLHFPPSLPRQDNE